MSKLNRLFPSHLCSEKWGLNYHVAQLLCTAKGNLKTILLQLLKISSSPVGNLFSQLRSKSSWTLDSVCRWCVLWKKLPLSHDCFATAFWQSPQAQKLPSLHFPLLSPGLCFSSLMLWPFTTSSLDEQRFYFSWVVLKSPVSLGRVLGHSVSGGPSETWPWTWRKNFSPQSEAVFLAFSFTELAAYLCSEIAHQ